VNEATEIAANLAPGALLTLVQISTSKGAVGDVPFRFRSTLVKQLVEDGTNELAAHDVVVTEILAAPVTEV
jgi:hypothetical protein